MKAEHILMAKGRRKIRVEHGFDGEIEGFPGELRQVFTNVIKNAVEATSEGGSIRIFSVSTQEADRNGVLVHVTEQQIACRIERIVDFVRNRCGQASSDRQPFIGPQRCLQTTLLRNVPKNKDDTG